MSFWQVKSRGIAGGNASVHFPDCPSLHSPRSNCRHVDCRGLFPLPGPVMLMIRTSFATPGGPTGSLSLVAANRSNNPGGFHETHHRPCPIHILQGTSLSSSASHPRQRFSTWKMRRFRLQSRRETLHTRGWCHDAAIQYGESIARLLSWKVLRLTLWSPLWNVLSILYGPEHLPSQFSGLNGQPSKDDEGAERRSVDICRVADLLTGSEESVLQTGQPVDLQH